MQKAFVITRGADFRERVQETPPLSEEKKKEIVDRCKKRYATDIEEGGQDNEFCLKSSVHGYETHCYETILSTDEDQERIDIQTAFKRRPQKTKERQEEETFPGTYDEEAKVSGTEPERHSNIMGKQIKHLEQEKNMNLKNITELNDVSVMNDEATRTMKLLVHPGEKPVFKKGEPEFDAALSTPLGKTKALFLAEWYPNLEITEIEAKRDNKDDEIQYIQYRWSPS